MPTITVRCPTCDCELELDAQYSGQEVECGSCHQVFEAKSSRSKRPVRDEPEERDREERRPSSRRRKPRRYADEDDDYDDDFYDRRRRDRDDGTGLGDAALIIGILAGFVFWRPLLGVPLTRVGVLLACLWLRAGRNGTAIAGVVLNIVFMLGSLAFLLFMGIR